MVLCPIGTSSRLLVMVPSIEGKDAQRQQNTNTDYDLVLVDEQYLMRSRSDSQGIYASPAMPGDKP
jgi:hypothetical protein